jgi:hypothetical protein
MMISITLYSPYMSVRILDNNSNNNNNNTASMSVDTLVIAYIHEMKIWHKFQLQNEAAITIRKLNA